MATLQILTNCFFDHHCTFCLCHWITWRTKKKKKLLSDRVNNYNWSNRADRVEQHIRGLKDINTDTIATDVLYDFYLDTLRGTSAIFR